jgi:hypothetical protein
MLLLQSNETILQKPFSNALGGITANFESAPTYPENSITLGGINRIKRKNKNKKTIKKNNVTKRQKKKTHKCIQRKYRDLYKKKTKKMRFS